jgi:lipopolysaccharide/colanic/teichoic acid biosynthesis glycosyltransferase
VIDVIITLIALPFALLAMSICVLVIYLDSPGPVLFIQERIGKGGRPFRIYKLRTLKLNLDQNDLKKYMKAYIRGEVEDTGAEAVFKPVQGNQIIRFGQIMRKLSLDELPQLFNVLKGEMSIVGPRPNILWEVEDYRPWHHERLEVLPGITGLAQVRGRSCINFNSLVRYDIEYVERCSLALDLKILWLTAMTILKAKGAL